MGNIYQGISLDDLCSSWPPLAYPLLETRFHEDLDVQALGTSGRALKMAAFLERALRAKSIVTRKWTILLVPMRIVSSLLND